jgi:hypothetical protein
MKLRELFENTYEEMPAGNSELQTIGICYGRWNPPHKGHKHVWEECSRNPIWFIGTNQNTEGPKDPLPYDIKLQVMAAIWKGVAGHVIPEQDLFVMATHIFEKYGENVHLKVYTDEDWLASSLQKYNGQLEQKHGGYKFAQIDQVKTQRLARATDLRAAVRSGDKNSFYKDAGVKSDTVITVGEKSYPIFEIVAHYLNKYPEKVKKVAEGMSVKPSGKMNKDSITASQGYVLARDVGGFDRAYHQNRMGLAMAMADGKSKKAVDMDASSWVEKYNVYFPYTDEEQLMVYQAMATIPTDGQELETRGKSQEPKDTNKVSTVAAPKRNKYGI